MSCERIFLDLKQSGIDAAAEWLLGRYQSGELIDLTQVTIVLPTRRAGRRLREALLDFAEDRGCAIFPPRITPVGTLPEMLYDHHVPFASPLVQQLAWAEALRATRRSELRHLVASPAKRRDDSSWLELAAMLQRQHLELSGHQLDFNDVWRQGEQLEGFQETERWKVLADIQTRYLKLLDEQGFWDRETARRFAIDHDRCRFQGDIVLLGTVDLTPTVREMLRRCSVPVIALVYAPSAWQDRFDEFGCVRPDAWQTLPLDIKDRHLLIADGPANQADAVVHAIRDWDGEFAADELTIGVPDDSLVPMVRQKLALSGVPTRYGAGRPIEATRPVQWLRVLADVLNSRSIASYGEWLRHPDTQSYLFEQGMRTESLRELHNACEQRLPETIDELPDDQAVVVEAKRILDELLQPLLHEQRQPGEWCPVLLQLIGRLYEQREFNPQYPEHRTTWTVCEELQKAIASLERLPAALAPTIRGAQAVLMWIDALGDVEIPEPASEGCIEMIGWLELVLDDAKAIIVTGVNEGIIPRTVNSDLFLPNQLRQTLQIDDNSQRYARDAYAMQALLLSRHRVRLVVGRRTADDDPLRPSRLLLARPQADLPQRCIRLFDEPTTCKPMARDSALEKAAFAVPRPRPLETEIDAISVSGFKAYLECPYRFYLSSVLKLRPVELPDVELDARAFGTLTHDVLERFARSDVRDSSDPVEIGQQLRKTLDQLVELRFGRRPRAVIQVQRERLWMRLEAFAHRQAEWRSQGWQITEFVEAAPEKGYCEFQVDGRPMQIRGRIDRIDIHRSTNRVAVLDYKTGDSGSNPQKNCVRSSVKVGEISADDWIDLQLPMYRHLARDIGLEGEFVMGYVLLPRSPNDVAFSIARWDQGDLLAADAAAQRIVRQIRNQEFWPPNPKMPFPDYDNFAAICQVGIFGREEFAIANEGQEPSWS